MTINRLQTRWFLERSGIKYRLNTTTIIGSEDSCDIVLAHSSIAGVHAQIKTFQNSVIVYLRNPENDVFIEHDRINVTSHVMNGEIIAFGAVGFVLRRKRVPLNNSFNENQVQEISSTNFQ